MTGRGGVLAAALLVAAAANSGDADEALMLGRLPTYGTEREAEAACGRDAVVWAERYAGYYFGRGEAQYGSAPFGAYACRKDAAAANYWDTDPIGGVTTWHGKSFPSSGAYGS